MTRKEPWVQPKLFTNLITGQILACADTKDIRTIDGVEYLVVTRPNDYQHRSFMIRRDSVKPIEKTINKS